MHYFNMLLTALASALCATYLVLWLTKPAPIENATIPPLIFKEEQGEVVIWGGWKTVEGYQTPGTNAVEIRCNRTSSKCHEAYASPRCAGLYTDALDLFAGVPGVEDAVDLFFAEAGGLVDDDAAGKIAGVTVLVETDAAAHHRAHLVAGQVRVV